jgi:leucyl aminopeptidase
VAPRISLTDDAPATLRADAIALPIAAGEALEGAALELDRALEGLIGEALRSREHRGRQHEVLVLPTVGRVAARRVLLYGLGTPADLDGQRLRFAHQEMVRAARNYGYRRVAVLRASPLRLEDLPPVVEGCVMGTWERRSRQSGNRSADLEGLVLAGFGAGREQAVTLSQRLGDATNRAREWQNAPANELGTETLATIAQDLGTRHGLEVEILGPQELAAEGYRLLLGVGSGSSQPSLMIRLQHHGGDGGRTLALAGKGITFDTGGVSMKTATAMQRMRGDMAGAAAVLAAMEVIAAQRMPVDVMAVVPAAENMVSRGAQRPGDVWTSASGKTVEVVNTDAEGRLVLADAMTFAIRRGATHLVDLATLTGTAAMALGHAATVALTSDPELWALVGRAAHLAGERVWPLPIYPEYRALLRSRSADLRNGFYGEAQTICGGMFIQEFTEGRPWVHLDIAASTWNENAELSTIPRGPLGTGTRLCVRLAELFAGAGR